ncbi:hypothetical protein O988_03455 [Pseudogymnoascus sp. VKM F-3808]|nr:hypothetical protein O988_03455 [Pseudogymnoascus sp. VKM F-3808]
MLASDRLALGGDNPDFGFRTILSYQKKHAVTFPVSSTGRCATQPDLGGLLTFYSVVFDPDFSNKRISDPTAGMQVNNARYAPGLCCTVQLAGGREAVMDTDTHGRKKVLDGYDNINLDGLQQDLSRLLGLQCQFIMDSLDRPFGGSECVIVVLKDEAGSKWAVRFPLQFRAFPGHVVRTVKKEVELRQAIEKAGIQRITKLKAISSTFDNPARFPFVVSEWAEGNQLRWTESYPALPQRNEVIRSVAQVVVDLLQVQNKECTATGYITTLIDRKIKRARDNKLPGATVSECLDQQSLIAEYLLPDLDQAPCVLVHGDLTAENIIVGQDFNVKAIIDLGFAEIIPLQFSACFPNFLAHEFESPHEPTEVEHGSGGDGPLEVLVAGGGYQVEGPSRYGGVQLVTNVVPEQPSGVLKGGLKVPLGKYNVYAVLFTTQIHVLY